MIAAGPQKRGCKGFFHGRFADEFLGAPFVQALTRCIEAERAKIIFDAQFDNNLRFRVRCAAKRRADCTLNSFCSRALVVNL